MPEPKDARVEHDDTSGSYVLNVIYMVLFTLGFLFMFWELSQRWPVS